MDSHSGLLVETLVNGPFMENCFIVGDAETREGLLIDPGDEGERIMAALQRLELTPTVIFGTHAHIDHVAAVAQLKESLGVPFALHLDERSGLERMPMQAAVFGLPQRPVPEVDRELAHGDSVKLGSLEGRVLLTPGHSAGGCCLYFEDQGVVFAGDTLFAGSIGRTDLPGGSMQTLLTSINEQLLSLPDSVVVYCGHGPATTIGAERRANPFLQPGAGLI
jgi:glyoxylase-like metal-dependent hydrolase (beta-lactamase superfamily II)